MHAMRRYPEHRYPAAADLLDDLDRLDTLDPAQYDMSPEPPMGGMAGGGLGQAALGVGGPDRRVGFIGIVAVIIALTRRVSVSRLSPTGGALSDNQEPGWVRLIFVDVFGASHAVVAARRPLRGRRRRRRPLRRLGARGPGPPPRGRHAALPEPSTLRPWAGAGPGSAARSPTRRAPWPGDPRTALVGHDRRRRGPGLGATWPPLSWSSTSWTRRGARRPGAATSGRSRVPAWP